MSVITEIEARTVVAEVARRWQAIDPLLPSPELPAPSCGAGLMVAGPGTPPAGLGTCEHWTRTPESSDLSWGAAHRFQLTARIAGHDVAAALDQLLSQWRDHLARVPGASAEDSIAVVGWPSRDIEGTALLLRRGLTPLAVIAARHASRHRPSVSGTAERNGTTGGGLRIRRAEPADIDTVVRLGLDVLEFDAHFGVVDSRPGMADTLRREAATLLAGPGAWTWLAEHDGRPVGMLAARPPATADWAASLAKPAPAAYVALMDVLPEMRGSGVGSALVARFHRAAEAARVAVTLLRYEQCNPQSVPFWSRQGYRPLWTFWVTRPACALS